MFNIVELKGAYIKDVKIVLEDEKEVIYVEYIKDNIEYSVKIK